MTDNTAPPFTLLLIEDEPADAHLVKMSLKANHTPCRLFHVGDGAEALAFLRRQAAWSAADAPRPDLILLDLNMPRMNGREFLAKIKADPELASIPVIVLTTSDLERDVEASYQLGASGFITKPLEIERFIEIIRLIGDYWFSTARLPGKAVL